MNCSDQRIIKCFIFRYVLEQSTRNGVITLISPFFESPIKFSLEMSVDCTTYSKAVYGWQKMKTDKDSVLLVKICWTKKHLKYSKKFIVGFIVLIKSRLFQLLSIMNSIKWDLRQPCLELYWRSAVSTFVNNKLVLNEIWGSYAWICTYDFNSWSAPLVWQCWWYKML